jgi:hypothetical protein
MAALTGVSFVRGLLACGQALRFRLLRFQIELCCCYYCGGITCGNGNAVMIIGDDCGASACWQAPPLGTAWPNRLGRVGEGGGWRLAAALGWTGAGSVGA